MQARMRQVYLFAVLVGTLVIVLGGTAFAQSGNSEVGSWKLNLAKSKYNQGPLQNGRNQAALVQVTVTV